MKKIFLGVGILALMGLSACEEKNETIISPDAENGSLTFELQIPEAGSEAIYTLLEESEGKVVETLTYGRPDYGFGSATPTYSAQISLDADFKNAQTLKSVSQAQSFDLETKELNTAILNLHTQGAYPDLTEVQVVYVRMVSTISPVVKPAYSNSVTMQVVPYELQNIALPATYYIIGLGGNWDNSPAGIGSSLIPLSLIAEYPYNPADGKGKFVYTGYFAATEGFKIIGTPGNWADAWGMENGDYVYGRGENISVPANGYYRITLDTEKNILTIEPKEVTPAAIQWVEMLGDFSGWDAAPVIMKEIEATKGGVWVSELTLPENSGLKFRADGKWDVNWGGKSFPYGMQPSGDNIPAEAGTYQVVFNQIDNCYFFFKK